MLTIPRAQLVEKLITSPEGVVFRAYFFVYEEDGRIKARLVRAVPVAKKQNPIVFALAGTIAPTFAVEIISEVKEEKIISPYTSLLYVSGSKPRAPSLIA